MVVESSLRSAQISAVPTGWWMKSSPLLRLWSRCMRQATTKARVMSSRSSVGVVDRDGAEHLIEQRPLALGYVVYAEVLRQVLGKRLCVSRVCHAR